MKSPEYFELSRKRKVPMRCPILSRCARRAYTLYFYGYYKSGDPDVSVSGVLARDGVLPPDFDATCIQVRGEAPAFNRNSDYIHYCNMCPEVNLFEQEFALPFAFGTASVSGDWNDVEGLHHATARHFTECPEYAAWSAEFHARKPTKQRDSITPKNRFAVFTRDSFRCQYCGRTAESGAILHVDHRVSVHDGGSNYLDNLVTACDRCNLGKGKQSIQQNDLQ